MTLWTDIQGQSFPYRPCRGGASLITKYFQVISLAGLIQPSNAIKGAALTS